MLQSQFTSYVITFFWAKGVQNWTKMDLVLCARPLLFHLDEHLDVVKADSPLQIYAYVYCLTAGAGLNPALLTVQISRWLSNLFHDVKFRQLVTQLVLTLGQIVDL